MIWRAMVSVCGVAVIAAATHGNVLHAGGYGSDAAPLIIAMAALLTVGMGFVGLLWSDRLRVAAAALAVCIIAGEVYWLCTNAEREIAQREAQGVPAAVAHDVRLAAEKRLSQAETDKRIADAAAVSEAAKPGCRTNCAQLLSAAQLRANEELRDARASVAALPRVQASDGLAARLGVAPWAWDLWMAALRSIGVMGASIAVGLSLHARCHPRATSAVTNLQPVRRRLLPQVEHSATDRRSKPHQRDVREHVSAFLMDCVRPDSAAGTSLRELHARYLPWCRSSSKEPLPTDELGRELRSIVEAVGLKLEPTGKDVIIRGVAICG